MLLATLATRYIFAHKFSLLSNFYSLFPMLILLVCPFLVHNKRETNQNSKVVSCSVGRINQLLCIFNVAEQCDKSEKQRTLEGRRRGGHCSPLELPLHSSILALKPAYKPAKQNFINRFWPPSITCCRSSQSPKTFKGLAFSTLKVKRQSSWRDQV